MSCFQSKVENPRLNDAPRVILWAWERPENLEFLDSKKYGVAFLAQTLELETDEVLWQPRRQPLNVKDDAYLIAVTRIENVKNRTAGLNLSDARRGEILNRILKTLESKNVRAIQIDFDAAVSQREFYRQLLLDLRARLPDNVPLSITALASFCIGDLWFANLPVDEAVPMIFDMGADSENIKKLLANGEDFREPLCRRSYGFAVNEIVSAKLDAARRLYFFNSRAWSESDLQIIEKFPK